MNAIFRNKKQRYCRATSRHFNALVDILRCSTDIEEQR
jgi:hypothetical protein